MRKNPQITVIIPCYNCEDTLERAINSVINQSLGFENIELILYDDCSSDNTRLIIDKFSKKYENIIPIFSNENSGYPGKGRNKGIENATADLIMFMDNDDEYDKDICKKLYDEMILEKCDLVSCNFLNINNNYKRISNYNYYYGEEIGNKVIFSHENTIYFSCRLVWACIFKKEIIQKNNIKFPEDSFSEDVYFLSLYNLFANKTIYLKNYVGIYRHVQDDSQSNSLSIVKINKQLDTLELILDSYEKLNCNLSLIFEDIVPVLLYNIYNNGLSKEPNSELYPYFKRIKKYEERINLKNINDKVLNIANKLILKEHYYLTKKYLNMLFFLKRLGFLKKIYRFFN